MTRGSFFDFEDLPDSFDDDTTSFQQPAPDKGFSGAKAHRWADPKPLFPTRVGKPTHIVLEDDSDEVVSCKSSEDDDLWRLRQDIEAQQRYEAEQKEYQRQLQEERQRKQLELEQQQALEQEQLEKEVRADVWAQGRSVQLEEELRDVALLGKRARKLRLRALQLELHPDKHPPELRSAVQPLFLRVQSCWESKEDDDYAEEQDRARRKQAERKQAERDAAHAAERNAAEMNAAQAAQRQAAEERDRERAAARRRAKQWAGQEEEEGHGDDKDDSDQAELQAPPDNTPVDISFAGLNGDVGQELCRVSAKRDWRVGQLRQALETKAKVSQKIARLLCNNRELYDSEPLSNLPAGRLLNLHVVLKPPKYSDWNWVYQAATENFNVLQHADPQLRGDRVIVEVAVRKDWKALQYAAPELQNDRELVSLAIKQNGFALEKLSRKLRGDRDICFAAVEQNWQALQFVGPKLRANKALIKLALQQDSKALQYAAASVLADRELLLQAVNKDGLALRHASAALRADKQLVLAAVRRNGLAFEFAAPELKRSRDFVFQVGKTSTVALKFVDKDLREEVEEQIFESFNAF